MAGDVKKRTETLDSSAKLTRDISSPSSSSSSLECTNTSKTYHRHHSIVVRDDEDEDDEMFPNDVSEDLRSLTEQRVPDLCVLDGEPIRFVKGTKFYCTINDILTSDGEFWVERELSNDNERKFRHFIEILSLFAVSYESLKRVYVGQLVALHYESSWHRALVVSTSDGSATTIPASARVRLVDYGSSLYVNVSQLKWLPEQFYLFPFKAVECTFSEAVKPTFSDTVRLTFKQLVLNKRLRVTVYDRDGTRVCILLKCKIEEGTINVYRYLRAHEHKSKHGRMLADGDIVTCLRNTIINNSSFLDQSTMSSKSAGGVTNVTLPLLLPPPPITLTRDQLLIRRAEISKIYEAPLDSSINSNDVTTADVNNNNNNNNNILKPPSSSHSTPFSASTVVTPMPRLSFAQQ